MQTEWNISKFVYKGFIVHLQERRWGEFAYRVYRRPEDSEPCLRNSCREREGLEADAMNCIDTMIGTEKYILKMAIRVMEKQRHANGYGT